MVALPANRGIGAGLPPVLAGPGTVDDGTDSGRLAGESVVDLGNAAFEDSTALPVAGYADGPGVAAVAVVAWGYTCEDLGGQACYVVRPGRRSGSLVRLGCADANVGVGRMHSRLDWTLDRSAGDSRWYLVPTLNLNHVASRSALAVHHMRIDPC